MDRFVLGAHEDAPPPAHQALSCVDGDSVSREYMSIVTDGGANSTAVASTAHVESVPVRVARPVLVRVPTAKTANQLPLTVDSVFRACDTGNRRVLVELCDVHTNVAVASLRDAYGWTPLQTAAAAGHQNVIIGLLSRGVVADERDLPSAAELAEKRGWPNIAKVLRDAERDAAAAAAALDREEEDEDNDDLLLDGVSSRQRAPGDVRCDECNVWMRADAVSVHHCSIGHVFKTAAAPMRTPAYGTSLRPGTRPFALLVRSGWTPHAGIGVLEEGRLNPVHTQQKADRSGVGAPTTTSASVRGRGTRKRKR